MRRWYPCAPEDGAPNTQSGGALCRLTLPRALLSVPKACSHACRFCSLGSFWTKLSPVLLQNSRSSQLCGCQGLGLGGSVSMLRKDWGTRKGRLSPKENQMSGDHILP